MPSIVTINVGSAFVGQTNGYSDLRSAMIGLHARDLVLNDEMIDVLVHENQTFSATTGVSPKTWDSQHYLTIRPAHGLGVNEINSSGPLDYGTVGIELSVTAGNVRIGGGVSLENFRLRLNSTSSSHGAILLGGETGSPFGGTRNATIRKCRILVQSVVFAGISPGSTPWSIFEDNIIFNESSTGHAVRHGTALVQRNTVIGRGNGAGRAGMLNGAANNVTAYIDNVFVNCGETPITRLTTIATASANNFADTAITGSSDSFTVAPNLVVSTSDARPTNGGPLIGVASSSSNNTTDIRGLFRGTVPDVGASMLNAATMPERADATITSVVVTGQQVTISGTYNSVATSGVCNLLPAASNPNGASNASKAVSINSADKTFSVTFSGIIPGNYQPPQVVLSNIVGDGASQGGSSFTVAVPASPSISILSQEKTTNSVTLTGDISGFPVSGSVTLTAISSGATTRNAPLVINGNNYTVNVTGITPGEYAAPVVEVANFSGTGSATGRAFTLYAQGTQPQGLASVDLPAYAPPSFNAPSIANGGLITEVTLQNTSGTQISSIPFSFGMVFSEGALKVSDSIVGEISGSNLPIQVDSKATHVDGSLRHAVLSGLCPVIAGSGQVTLVLKRSSAQQPEGSATVNDVIANSTPRIELQIGGETFTADVVSPAQASKVSTAKQWLKGAICNEFVISIPFKNASGADHPTLTAQFCVRHYGDSRPTKIDFIVENSKAYQSTSDVTYAVNVFAGGNSAFQQASLVHYALGRWKKTVWLGGDNSVHVKYSPAYLVETKVFPNWDASLMAPESLIATTYANHFGPSSTFDYGPMKFGAWETSMAATAGRADIGLAPQWYVEWLLFQDHRCKEIALSMADCAGGWSIHRRDNSQGPATGQPMTPLYWPYSTQVGTVGDSYNPATGLQEKLPNITTINPATADVSHQPAFGYIPYVLTGDHWYLEEMLFWASYIGCGSNPNYRERYKGLINHEQIRGQGWTLRTFAQLGAILPDSHIAKQEYNYYANNNFNWYNTRYTDNANSNKLGAIINGTWAPYTSDNGENTAIGPWQHDFFTQSVGHASELGFASATKLAKWVAKYSISRMIAPGFCWIHASMYQMTVCDYKGGPIYETFSKCYDETVNPQFLGVACNSPEMVAILNQSNPNPPYTQGRMIGYADATMGYPANMQPALAMSVDTGYADGDLAWSLFDDRPVKPDYRYGPQFAIVPRSTSMAPVTRYVSLTMRAFNSENHEPIQDLKWAWFDQITPNLVTAPTDFGSSAEITSEGVLNLQLPNTSKQQGEVGWLIVTDSDGNPETLHKAFSGPVTVM